MERRSKKEERRHGGNHMIQLQLCCDPAWAAGMGFWVCHTLYFDEFLLLCNGCNTALAKTIHAGQVCNYTDKSAACFHVGLIELV
eukprot:3408671-Amphidinium_carterae.1